MDRAEQGRSEWVRVIAARSAASCTRVRSERAARKILPKRRQEPQRPRRKAEKESQEARLKHRSNEAREAQATRALFILESAAGNPTGSLVALQAGRPDVKKLITGFLLGAAATAVFVHLLEDRHEELAGSRDRRDAPATPREVSRRTLRASARPPTPAGHTDPPSSESAANAGVETAVTRRPGPPGLPKSRVVRPAKITTQTCPRSI